jgi:RNA polymerase sigma-70 factor (ECF subfamily)
MMDARDLEEAIARVLQGRLDEFAVVIEKCHVPVRALISAWVHNLDDADDLAQETFLFAYQHVREYEPGTNFPAWIKAIARNLVMKYHKKDRDRRASVLHHLHLEVARRAWEIAEPLPESPRVEALQRCIELLPAAQRSFLGLAHARTVT